MLILVVEELTRLTLLFSLHTFFFSSFVSSIKHLQLLLFQGWLLDVYSQQNRFLYHISSFLTDTAD